MMLKLRVYTTQQDKQPFTEWYKKIKDLMARARIENRLEQLRLGNYGDCKSVGGHIFELRLFFGPGYRIYLAKDGNAIVVLLCGGDKSSQESDIKKAKKYLHDYKEMTEDEKETLPRF